MVNSQYHGHKQQLFPIPKPGKDNTDPNNYRLIALTSCVCKTIERMINKRLVWFLKSNNILSNIECGFRKTRSTIDHLVGLENFIRDAFVNKEHTVSIFFLSRKSVRYYMEIRNSRRSSQYPTQRTITKFYPKLSKQ